MTQLHVFASNWSRPASPTEPFLGSVFSSWCEKMTNDNKTAMLKRQNKQQHKPHGNHHTLCPGATLWWCTFHFTMTLWVVNCFQGRRREGWGCYYTLIIIKHVRIEIQYECAIYYVWFIITERNPTWLYFSHTPDRDIPWLHPCGICLSHTLVSGIRRPDVGWTAHKWSY